MKKTFFLLKLSPTTKIKMSTYFEANEREMFDDSEPQNMDVDAEEDNAVPGEFDEDDIGEARNFLLSGSVNHNIYHGRLMKNSETLRESILLYFERRLPFVSIRAVDTPSSQLMEASRDKVMNLKNFNAYRCFTPKELESRLNNVTVIALETVASSDMHPALDCRQLSNDELSCKYLSDYGNLEFASPLWFAAQYMKCVDGEPTTEIYQMIAIASISASAAFHSAGDYQDNLPFSELLITVAVRAALNVSAHVELQKK